MTGPARDGAAVGERVRYAEGAYEVARVNADLLVLVGVATWDARGRYGRCREPITVLASDVERAEGQGE